MKLLSLNVLHGVHELNYSYPKSPVLERFNYIQDVTSAESKRMENLLQFIVKRAAHDCIFALQEVPGILFQNLKKLLPSYRFFTYVHLRVPIMKVDIANPYGHDKINCCEHLVTIIGPAFNQPMHSCVVRFDKHNDHGKAALIVSVGSLDIYNFHMEYGLEKRLVNLQQLLIFAEKHPRQNRVMIGDSNMTWKEWFHDSREVGIVDTLLNIDIVTREGYDARGILCFRQLDHICFSSGVQVSEPLVENTNALSDHYLIGANVEQLSFCI